MANWIITLTNLLFTLVAILKSRIGALSQSSFFFFYYTGVIFYQFADFSPSYSRCFKQKIYCFLFFSGLIPRLLGDVLSLWICNLLAHLINTYAIDDSVCHFFYTVWCSQGFCILFRSLVESRDCPKIKLSGKMYLQVVCRAVVDGNVQKRTKTKSNPFFWCQNQSVAFNSQQLFPSKHKIGLTDQTSHCFYLR